MSALVVEGQISDIAFIHIDSHPDPQPHPSLDHVDLHPVLQTGKIVVGLGIAAVSCVVTSLANSFLKSKTNLQALRIQEHGILKACSHCDKAAIVVVVLYVSGALLDFLSLGFMTMSIRACSSGMSIPINAAVARCVLGEKMSAMQKVGALLIFVGLSFALWFGNRQEEGNHSSADLFDLLRGPLGLFLCGLSPMFLVSLCITNRKLQKTVVPADRQSSELSLQVSEGRTVESHNVTEATSPAVGGEEMLSPQQRCATWLWRTVLLISANFCAAFCALLTNLVGKFCAEVIGKGGVPEFGRPWLYVGAVLAIVSGGIQIMMMERMFKLFDSTVAIPPYQVILMVLLIVFGWLSFGEEPSSLPGFVLALALAWVGIFVTALYQNQTDHAPPTLTAALERHPSALSLVERMGVSPRALEAAQRASFNDGLPSDLARPLNTA